MFGGLERAAFLWVVPIGVTHLFSTIRKFSWANLSMVAPSNDKYKDMPTAQERVAELNTLYINMRDLLRSWMSQCEEPSTEMSKKMLQKINDMQTAHMLVLKAEEAFHARCKTSADTAHPDTIADIENVRLEIGRKLDSLRETIAESGVSGKPDAG
jgi:hypothetical protein